MIFALFDYINYRNRKCIYSAENISAQGGKLATSNNFPNLHKYGAGDLFLYHGYNSLLSWLVMYYTSSAWSHTGLFTENGNIIDSTTAGVMEHPLSDYFDGKSYICIVALKEGIATKEQLQEGIKWARSTVGCSYNWHGIIRLFLRIIMGAHADYRPRYSCDILLLLSLLLPLCALSNMICMLLLSLSVIYLLIVIINTPRRRKMRILIYENSGIKGRFPH